MSIITATRITPTATPAIVLTDSCWPPGYVTTIILWFQLACTKNSQSHYSNMDAHMCVAYIVSDILVPDWKAKHFKCKSIHYGFMQCWAQHYTLVYDTLTGIRSRWIFAIEFNVHKFEHWNLSMVWITNINTVSDIWVWIALNLSCRQHTCIKGVSIKILTSSSVYVVTASYMQII